MEPTGPSDETLRSLGGMLPTFVKGMKEGKTIGKGIHPIKPRPRKVCKVCGHLWDYVTPRIGSEDRILQGEFCKDCQKMRDDGYLALTCAGRYSWVKSERLADKAGEIVPISEEVMAQVQNMFELEFKVKKESTDEQNTPD